MSNPKQSSVNAQDQQNTHTDRLTSNVPWPDADTYKHLYATFYFENTADAATNGGISNTLKHVLTETGESVEEFVKAYFNFLANQTDQFAKYYLLHRYWRRLFVMENSKAYDIVNEQAVMSSMNINKMASGQHKMNSDSCLRVYLASFNFTMSSLAAPTHGSNGDPISLIVRPFSDFFLPPKCNIIFSDQVASMSFQNNLLGAPTRLAATTSPMFWQAVGDVSTWKQDIYVAPGFGRVIQSDGSAKTIEPHLTYDEHVRGINGSRLDLSNQYYTTNTAKTNISTTGNTPQVEDDLQLKKDIGVTDDTLNELYAHYQRLVDLEYDNQRFSNRTCDITTTYNPNRLVGFPGVFIDTRNLNEAPTIIGQIANINSRITADGSGSSQITIHKPRVLWARGITSAVPKYTFNDLADYFFTLGVEPSEMEAYARKLYDEGYDGFPKIEEEMKDPDDNTVYGPEAREKDKIHIHVGTVKGLALDKVAYTSHSWLHNSLVWQHLLHSRLNDDHVELRTDWYGDEYLPQFIGRSYYQGLVYGDRDYTTDLTQLQIELEAPTTTNHQAKLATEEGFDELSMADGSIHSYISTDSTALTNLARTAECITNLKNIYTSRNDANKDKEFAQDTFSNQESRRRLMDEDSFWKFFLKIGPNSTTTVFRPHIDKHYREVTTSIFENDEATGETLDSLYKDEAKDFKPFTLQHASRVYELVRAQSSHTGGTYSNI